MTPNLRNFVQFFTVLLRIRIVFELMIACLILFEKFYVLHWLIFLVSFLRGWFFLSYLAEFLFIDCYSPCVLPVDNRFWRTSFCGKDEFESFMDFFGFFGQVIGQNDRQIFSVLLKIEKVVLVKKFYEPRKKCLFCSYLLLKQSKECRNEVFADQANCFLRFFVLKVLCCHRSFCIQIVLFSLSWILEYWSFLVIKVSFLIFCLKRCFNIQLKWSENWVFERIFGFGIEFHFKVRQFCFDFQCLFSWVLLVWYTGVASVSVWNCFKISTRSQCFLWLWHFVIKYLSIFARFFSLSYHFVSLMIGAIAYNWGSVETN